MSIQKKCWLESKRRSEMVPHSTKLSAASSNTKQKCVPTSPASLARHMALKSVRVALQSV